MYGVGVGGGLARRAQRLRHFTTVTMIEFERIILL